MFKLIARYPDGLLYKVRVGCSASFICLGPATIVMAQRHLNWLKKGQGVTFVRPLIEAGQDWV